MTIPRPRKDRPFVIVLGQKFFVDGRLGSNELTLEQLAKTSRGLAHLNEIAATSDEHWKVVSAVTTDFSPVARLAVRHKLNLNDRPVGYLESDKFKEDMRNLRELARPILLGMSMIVGIGVNPYAKFAKAAKRFEKKARKAGKELRINI